MSEWRKMENNRAYGQYSGGCLMMVWLPSFTFGPCIEFAKYGHHSYRTLSTHFSCTRSARAYINWGRISSDIPNEWTEKGHFVCCSPLSSPFGFSSVRLNRMGWVGWVELNRMRENTHTAHHTRDRSSSLLGKFFCFYTTHIRTNRSHPFFFPFPRL